MKDEAKRFPTKIETAAAQFPPEAKKAPDIEMKYHAQNCDKTAPTKSLPDRLGVCVGGLDLRNLRANAPSRVDIQPLAT